MLEAVSIENPKPKELINADSIRRRTMEFFQGVDLNKVGKSRNGPRTISTKFLALHIPEIWHEAMLDGFRLAEYHRLDETAKLEPLKKGADRQNETYILKGYTGNGEISVSLTEYERGPAEIRISIPGNEMNRDGKWGKIDEFTASEKELVAKVLGIKK